MESSPILEAAELAKKRKFWRVSLYFSIAALVLGPLICMVVPVLGMMHSFSALGESGVGDTGKLSDGIGAVLVSTSCGFLIGFVALIFLVISAIRLSGLKKPPMEVIVVQGPPA